MDSENSQKVLLPLHPRNTDEHNEQIPAPVRGRPTLWQTDIEESAQVYSTEIPREEH